MKMRKLLTGRTLLSLFFFLLMAYAVDAAQDFDPAARLLPLIIGIPTLILSAIVLVTELVSQWRGKPHTAAAAMDGSRVEQGLTPEQRRAATKREIVLSLWVIALVGLIWLLGILWSIPVFLVLFLRLQGRESWKLTIPISLGTWAVVYLLFVVVLQVQLYQGYIQDLLSS